jgi:SAM-dependent methyltransferase
MRIKKTEYKSEVNFWENFVKTEHGKNYFSAMANKERQLDSLLDSYIFKSQIKKTTLSILDVGCGPISSLGYKSVYKNIDLIGADPLIEEYNRILKDNNFIRPFNSFAVEGEKLSAFFHDKKFDIVYSRNAIDHSQDPIEVLKECVKVCRLEEERESGAFVMIVVMPKEGEHAGYEGLHQHDFYIESNQLFCKTKDCEPKNINKILNKFKIELFENKINQEKYEKEICLIIS